MPYVFLTLATALLAVWILCLAAAPRERVIQVLRALIRKKEREINDGKSRLLSVRERLENGMPLEKFRLRALGSEKSAIKFLRRLDKERKALKAGKITLGGTITLAGFRLLELLRIDANQNLYKNLYRQRVELYGRDKAVDDTEYLLANCISLLTLGAGISFLLGALLLFTGDLLKGLAVALGGAVVFFIIGYLPVDDIRDRLKKRQDEMTREFPRVVSKLALLVSAGMEVLPAWDQVSQSGTTPLYIQMRQVNEEVRNGISPVAAFENFIQSCNTKETSKLAASIMQNLTKGNDEIGAFLRTLSKESWDSRKHNARRAGELAGSRLLFPMLLMFAGILILVMVPVVMSFSSMGI